ncbi:MULTISPECIES: hypothetical protein [Microbacterium]|jgi:hypothetical protein|uniref:hypothetical protein n=1 Tax=Microbacterium TaxID=33882 RepID=UPI000D80AD10|nr:MULTISPECIES: hypothetical protein [Microbacterium]MCT2225775.1 hypothetical protein [Microbacterium paraoxydans]NYF29359.1 hypothetical protein [Microbacterium sp. JAI119]RBO73957.1 hypothetical protein DSP71_02355 [Microbacterium sp. H6]
MSSDIDTPLPPDALDPEILTAAVLDIDSVIDIYPPAPTLTQAPQLVAALITGAPSRINRVDVRSDGTAHTLTARIGTDRHTPAPQAAAHVADALLARIPGGHDATVTVQISRIA